MINNLTEIQNILCGLCANVLFDKNIYIPKNFDLNKLFDEAKHQTVFPIACVGLKREKVEKKFYFMLQKMFKSITITLK